MSETYVTSDLHLGHAMLVHRGLRDFKTVDQMDRTILRNINDRVGNSDTLFILGDFSLAGPEKRKFIERMAGKIKCEKKILIVGNHDRLNPMMYIECGFYQVCTHFEAVYAGHKVWMVHDPAWAELVPRRELVLCGHVHGLFRTCENVYNVGVDVNDFKPVNVYDAINTLSNNGGNG